MNKIELKLKGILKSPSPFICSAFTYQGNTILFGTTGSLLLARVLKLSASTEVKLKQESIQVLNVKTVAVNGEEQAIVLSDSSSRIVEYRLAKGILKQRWHVSSEGQYAKAIDLKENILAAGFTSAKVKLYDRERQTQMGQFISQPTIAGHTNRIFCVKFSKDDFNLAVTGGWDSSARFWDLRTNTSIGSIMGTFICGEALDLDFSRLLVGNNRSKEKLQIYDIRTMQLQQNLPFGGKTGVTSCMFDFYRKGMVLATGGRQLQVHYIWQEKKKLWQMRLGGEGQHLSMNQRGQIGVACQNGQGMLMSLEMQ